MPCACGYADECDGETAVFYPLQDGGQCSVRDCPDQCEQRATLEQVREGGEAMSTDRVSLEITSCKDCPFMHADRHYSGDSFELCFDWKCTKNQDAIIANMEWNDKPPAIPAWCPLRTKP